MLFVPPLSIGIDLSGSRPVYAALDREQRLVAMGRTSVEDVLAFLGGQFGALAAINVPLQTKQNSMPIQEDGRLPRERPASRWAERASVFFERLRKMGYVPYPSDARLAQWLTTNAQAAFSALAVQQLLPRHALEGRVQRQLILHEDGVGLLDPMEFFEEITRRKLLLGILPLDMIYTPSQLDALGAAYVAWLAASQPERLIRQGDVLFVPSSRAERPPAAE